MQVHQGASPLDARLYSVGVDHSGVIWAGATRWRITTIGPREWRLRKRLRHKVREQSGTLIVWEHKPLNPLIRLLKNENVGRAHRLFAMITHPLTKVTRDTEKHSSLLQGGLGGHFSLCLLGYNSAGECPRHFKSEEARWTFGPGCLFGSSGKTLESAGAPIRRIYFVQSAFD